MKKILVVEDDFSLSKGISLALENGETTILTEYRLRTARELLAKTVFDLIILDINLPDGNGVAFLREIRKSNDVPIILLTANDTEIDIILGLESGANDYITKPFSLAVLRARVNTQLRNKPKSESLEISSTIIRIEDFLFDFEKMQFTKNNFIVELSKTEQKLLGILVNNKGITMKREILLDKLWTDGIDFVEENALSVAIKRLRDKLEDNPSKPKYIKTVYGIGYRWVVE